MSVLFFGFLFSCSSVPVKVSPPSELIVFLKKAEDVANGLSQTKFSSVDGAKLRRPAATFQPDADQIVSFFSDKNTDGTANRGGLWIQGTPSEIIFDQNENPAYMVFADQKVRLLEYAKAFGSAQVVRGHDYAQHPKGFGTPIGFLKGWTAGIGEYSIRELKSLFEQYTHEGVTRLEFNSGLVVQGVIEKYVENISGNFGSPTVITFKKGTCEVKIGHRILFAPEDGVYDMTFPTVITETNVQSSKRLPAGSSL